MGLLMMATIKAEKRVAMGRLSIVMAPCATKENSKMVFHMDGEDPTMRKGDKSKESSSAE